MTDLVLLNLVFFIPATCGVTAIVLLWRRILRGNPPAGPGEPEGGAKLPLLPRAGPDDLARAA